MNEKPADKAHLIAELEKLFTSLRTLHMSTVSSEGIPDASYAPFIRGQDHCFYVYLSQLARHTRNLEATSRVSVLLIEDERETNQLFARKRLIFDCDATIVPRDSDVWNELMGAFADAFGEVMQLIRPLGDFKLFRLQPRGGTYVRGFGQAYRFVGATSADLEHITVEDQADRA